jgi:hypothetical protein
LFYFKKLLGVVVSKKKSSTELTIKDWYFFYDFISSLELYILQHCPIASRTVVMV